MEYGFDKFGVFDWGGEANAVFLFGVYVYSVGTEFLKIAFDGKFFDVEEIGESGGFEVIGAGQAEAEDFDLALDFRLDFEQSLLRYNNR